MLEASLNLKSQKKSKWENALETYGINKEVKVTFLVLMRAVKEIVEKKFVL